MIKREKYLKNIRGFYDADLIKVITGIRRCGKSTLLKQIIEELKANGIKEEQIIYLNLEYDDYEFIKDNNDLSKYLKALMVNDIKYYVFIDEIQNVKKWEKSVNSFKAKYEKNISIFITGSNSDLLSGEFSTLMSGRYVSFNISTFAFSEVMDREFGAFKDIDDNYPKYVLSTDKFDYSQNGIIHKNIIDWLLEK